MRRSTSPYNRKTARNHPPAAWMAALCLAGIALLLFLTRTGDERTFFSAVRRQNAPRPEQQQTIRVYHEDALTEMGLEDYLVGVTAAEMPAGYDAEALKAQAVAARTYTLRKLSRSGCSRAKNADICTDSGHCQAYASEERLKKRWGEDYDQNIEKIQQAVYETAGKIITYEGAAIDAMYHASAGGYTENSEDVYKNEIPYLRSVESPDAEGYEETVCYTREDFIKKVNKKLNVNLSADALETELEILSRYESGRVKKIRIGAEIFSGSKFRGAAGLPSAMFEYALTAKDISFFVTGYGHGVGMSQSGANYYAKQGWDHEKILLHYYTGVKLEQAELIASPQ